MTVTRSASGAVTGDCVFLAAATREKWAAARMREHLRKLFFGDVSSHKEELPSGWQRLVSIRVTANRAIVFDGDHVAVGSTVNVRISKS